MKRCSGPLVGRLAPAPASRHATRPQRILSSMRRGRHASVMGGPEGPLLLGPAAHPKRCMVGGRRARLHRWAQPHAPGPSRLHAPRMAQRWLPPHVAQARLGGWYCPPPARWRLSSTLSRRRARSSAWPCFTAFQRIARDARSGAPASARLAHLLQLPHTASTTMVSSLESVARPMQSGAPAGRPCLCPLSPSALAPPCRMHAAPSRLWPTSASSTFPSTSNGRQRASFPRLRRRGPRPASPSPLPQAAASQAAARQRQAGASRRQAAARTARRRASC